MDTDDVRFIKKKTSVADIEAHPTEDAIFVSYQMDASLLNESGNSLLKERKECRKTFRIKNLDQVKDIDILSLEIIKSSDKLISYGQVDEVKQIILHLISRKEVVNSSAAKIENLRPKTAGSIIRGNSKTQEPVKEEQRCLLDRNFWAEFSFLEHESPSINDLDGYVEQLYEIIPEKIRGAGLILKLAQSSDNLNEMASNETLLCALTRVLREEGRKSLDLSTLILATFASFSDFPTFHPVIISYKIGSQTLDLVKHELSREAEWQDELSSRQSSASTTSSNQSLTSDSRNGDSPAPSREKSFKRYKHLVLKQNQMLKVSFHLLLNLSEDSKLEQKIVNKGVLDNLVKCLEREADVELFILILKFLLKLSIYTENKNILAEKAIMEKLFIFFSSASKSAEPNQEFLTSILSLVYNMSFDLKVIKNMVTVGMVHKIFIFWCRNRMAIKRSLEQLVIKILYQVSREPSCRRAFDFSPGIGVESIDLFMNKVMRTLDISPTNSHRPVTSRLTKSLCVSELMALFINLSLDYKVAIRIAGDGRLAPLLDHVYGNRKPTDTIDLVTVLIVKVIRNLSNHSHEFKSQFVPFIGKISALVFEMSETESQATPARKSRKQAMSDSLKDDTSQAFLVESLAILGNLNDPHLSIEWFSLLEKVGGFEWLFSKLAPKSGTEDDLVLEVIIFLGTVCSEAKSASYFITNQGIDLVSEVLSRKQEDDEIVLQSLFLIYVVVEHQILKEQITSNTQISTLLLELMNDKNAEIKKLALATLDIFSHTHHVWANKVRVESFRTHNQQWLEMIQTRMNSEDVEDDLLAELEDDEESDQELDLNYVLRPELLSSLDSLQDSNSATILNETDGHKSRQSQRPITGYGRR